MFQKIRNAARTKEQKEASHPLEWCFEHLQQIFDHGSCSLSILWQKKKKIVWQEFSTASNDYEVFFSKKPFSSLGFYYTHVLIKVIHSRRIKELLSLFFAHFLSFCSHSVSVARLFFTFRKGFGFSTTPYTPPSSIQKSLKLTLAWPENDNKDIIICLLVCKISLK